MSVTASTCHESMDWLKRDAPANVPLIIATLLVFQEYKGLLKALAPQNVRCIFSTARVSQELVS